MASEDQTSGALPTEPASRVEVVLMTRSMLVDWQVLEHMQTKGVIRDQFALRADGCCKPDGGSCCVNAHAV